MNGTETAEQRKGMKELGQGGKNMPPREIASIFAFLGASNISGAVLGLIETLNASAGKTVLPLDFNLEQMLHDDTEALGKEAHYGQMYLHMFANIFIGKYMKADTLPSLFLKCRCNTCNSVTDYIDSLKPDEKPSDIKLHDKEYLNSVREHSCGFCTGDSTDIVSSAILYFSENSEVVRMYVRVKDIARLRDKIERRILYDLVRRLPDSELEKYLPSRDIGGLREIVNKEKVLIGDFNGIRMVAKDADTCYSIKKFIEANPLWGVRQINDYFQTPRELDLITKKGKKSRICVSNEEYNFINIYVEYGSFPYNIQIMTESAEEKDRTSKWRNHRTFSEIQTANKNYIRTVVRKIYGEEVTQAIGSFLDKVIKKH